MRLGRSGERSLRPDIAMVSLGLKLTGMANDEIYVVYFLVVFVSALVRGRDTDMTDYNAIGVKPTHTNACLYNDSQDAGTPENRKQFVTGGAHGGGGSNFTGSRSGTDSPNVQCTTH